VTATEAQFDFLVQLFLPELLAESFEEFEGASRLASRAAADGQ